jgi:hypothetical protein
MGRPLAIAGTGWGRNVSGLGPSGHLVAGAGLDLVLLMLDVSV